jgi:hypothetical protein
MVNTNKIINNILEDKESKDIYNPNICEYCGEKIKREKYIYHKGKYYHNDCFNYKPRGGKRR